MMWQRFTERARKCVFYAQEEAQKLGEGFVSTEHVLLGLLREECTATRILQSMGVDPRRVEKRRLQNLPYAITYSTQYRYVTDPSCKASDRPFL